MPLAPRPRNSSKLKVKSTRPKTVPASTALLYNIREATQKISPCERQLIRRYLLWCYKTTREELERIDRKFTQLMVDEVIVKQLRQTASHGPRPIQEAYRKHIRQFEEYIRKKSDEALAQKFVPAHQNVLQPDYLYLQNRLLAVQKAIGEFLGAGELLAIQSLYEEEMTRRILAAREHP